MKVLCIGRKGDVRSVALAWLLKSKGHDAIAVGMRCMGRDTRKMLLDWSELIIVLHEKCQEGVPEEHWHKTKIWQVGYSHQYWKEFDEKLVEILTKYIKREKL